MVAASISAYLLLASLLLGSFINLAADRLPRGESLLRPRSHCRACGRQLNVVDLLPVFGYAIRGGRCASCGTAIGISAPLVEGISGALMGAALLLQGLWPGALSGLGLVAAWGVAVVAVAWRRSGRTSAGPAGSNP